ncbi:hypothetical protein C8Q77DRAFT_1129059 [Trametes polyzona]|nr:hypothetical protein C8Q77DRAFT_1129059 [Trametes polyzona]
MERGRSLAAALTLLARRCRCMTSRGQTVIGVFGPCMRIMRLGLTHSSRDCSRATAVLLHGAVRSHPRPPRRLSLSRNDVFAHHVGLPTSLSRGYSPSTLRPPRVPGTGGTRAPLPCSDAQGYPLRLRATHNRALALWPLSARFP